METSLLAAGPTLFAALATLALSVVAVQQGSRPLATAALASTLLVLPASVLGNSLALGGAFEEVAAVEPAVKAVVLAERISEVMHGVAFAAGAALLSSTIALGAVIRTRPRVRPPGEAA
jgi:hypothetical protein